MKTKRRDTKYCGVDKNRIRGAEPELDHTVLSCLLRLIVDRYSIHIHKDVFGLPAPWTENPILSRYRFTNVRREHDRVTKSLIEHVSLNNDLSLEEKIINSFLFRAWNNPDTFIDFGGPWSSREVYSPRLKELVRPVYKELLEDTTDRKWWSSAYNQGGTKHAWELPTSDVRARACEETEIDIPLRVFHIGPWLDREDVVKRLLIAKDQQDAFEVIKSIRGFADFLAYQVFVDLSYIEKFPFSENEFVIAGPGCKRGIDKLFIDKSGMTYEECLFWLRDHINDEFWSLYEEEQTDIFWDPNHLFVDLNPEDRTMNVMSLENCFCELSKYLKVVNGTGRPKNRYIAK